jgi:aminoglycoside 3-N-acetyltransferase
MRARESLAVAEILSGADMARDGVLMVHSAFRGLKREGFCAQDFIDALLTWLGSRTLLMPTMTWRSVKPAGPEFNELTTESHTGILTEIFRTTMAQARSLHPTHSVAGCGGNVSEILDGHHLDDTPCSINSPYGRMRRFDAWVLLLGIGLEKCTAIHHAEELVDPASYLKHPADADRYTCVDRRGKSYEVRVRGPKDPKHPDHEFPAFEPKLHTMQRGMIGDVIWRLVILADLYDVVCHELKLQLGGRRHTSPPALSTVD